MPAFNNWNVIDNYNSFLKQKNNDEINKFFQEELLNKSKINTAVNAQAADEIYDLDKKISKATSSMRSAIAGMWAMRIFGILFIIIGITLIVCSIITKSLYLGAFVGGGSGGIALGALLFALSWLLKKKKLKEKSIIDDLQPQRDKKYQEAIKQLNNLYQLLNDRMSFDLVEKTFNYVKLNDYLTDGQFQDWIKYFPENNNQSTIFAISGKMGNNPFMIHRSRNTEMYDEVYTGSVTVMVRRTRTVNNRTESYMTPKVIVATTTNPAPRYWTSTNLLMLSSVLKDLNFNNIGAFKNEKKAHKYFTKNKNKMSPMDNPEFDKIFPCNRNDEIGFRTMFTPMAQEEMAKLLNNNPGYSYVKNSQINIINSSHDEMADLYYLSNRYYGQFDYREIKKQFIEFNQNFFNAIYFMMAPILTIPLFYQTRFFGSNKENNYYSSLSIESRVNLMNNKSTFISPLSVTENIFKSKRVSSKNDEQIDTITSYGFKTRTRVVIVPVMDFEAGLVNVPVVVIDYIPVSKSSNLTTKITTKNKKDDEDKKKINFALTSAFLTMSAPNEYKPDKDKIISESKNKKS